MTTQPQSKKPHRHLHCREFSANPQLTPLFLVVDSRHSNSASALTLPLSRGCQLRCRSRLCHWRHLSAWLPSNVRLKVRCDRLRLCTLTERDERRSYKLSSGLRNGPWQSMGIWYYSAICKWHWYRCPHWIRHRLLTVHCLVRKGWHWSS